MAILWVWALTIRRKFSCRCWRSMVLPHTMYTSTLWCWFMSQDVFQYCVELCMKSNHHSYQQCSKCHCIYKTFKHTSAFLRLFLCLCSVQSLPKSHLSSHILPLNQVIVGAQTLAQARPGSNQDYKVGPDRSVCQVLIPGPRLIQSH